MGANTNNTYFRNHKFIIADILTRNESNFILSNIHYANHE